MTFAARSTPARITFVGALCAALCAAVPMLTAGCSSAGYSALCSNSCDCTGCSTVKQQSCSKIWVDNEQNAESVGCGPELSTYLSCIESTATCIGATYRVGGCDVAQQRLDACLRSANCTSGLTTDFAVEVHCK